MSQPKLVVATGDPEKDLFNAFPGRVSLSEHWDLGGAGGVQAILTGVAEVDGARCAVMAAVAEVKGKLGVMRVSAKPSEATAGLAGVLDLAGCRQGIGERVDRFTAYDARRLRAMAAPAVATWQAGWVRVFALQGGRMRLVWEEQPSYKTDNGSISMINGLSVEPDARGMMVRWEDVYHPRRYDGPPTSPVSNLNEAVLLAADAWPDGARAEPMTRMRARVAAALGIEVAALRELMRTVEPTDDEDGWLFVTFDRDGATHAAAGRYVQLSCGDLAVDGMFPLGVAARIAWVSHVSLSAPGRIDLAAPARPSSLHPAEEAVEVTRYPPTLVRDDKPAKPAPHFGRVLQTVDAAGTPTLHLLSDVYGVVWRSGSPMPAELELVMGVDPVAHLLVGGRVYRFDGTTYRP